MKKLWECDAFDSDQWERILITIIIVLAVCFCAFTFSSCEKTRYELNYKAKAESEPAAPGLTGN